MCVFFFFFQAEDGIRDAQESRGLGDVYKRQSTQSTGVQLPMTRLMLPLVLLAACELVGALLHPLHIARPHESVLAMQGNLLPLGIFYTNISIGQPPVEFQVTVDTGSTDLLVPVKGCKGCKPGAPTYSPNASSSSAVESCHANCSSCVGPSRQQCGFSDSYLTCDLSNLTAICTVAGGIYRDTVQIGGMAASDVRFGGIVSQSQNFDQFEHIDGILGLAFKPEGFDVSPFERVVEQNREVSNVVQTCLTPSGGLLVLGETGDDSRHWEGELMWTPITLKAWYTVHADALFVNSKDTGVKGSALNGPFPSDPCIVDSGTNFLSLTSPAFDATVRLFTELCTAGKNLTGVCGINATSPIGLFGGGAVIISEESVNQFPDVTIVLKAVEGADPVPLTMGPAEYLIPVGGGKYRLGITRGDCIIGDTHMLRYWTVYDRANMRIGFAPARHDECVRSRQTLL
eukprot:TRINITY_DN3155_c0_g1_i2.p1 TRINITY_DN3155_c0_g1~~TRINITY_DN3155_c0_g1_i2.p1  ORF type:complete len:458 (+),score=102.15 TRINITY_DN3155_c0_g1_i2:125-1498(+)